MSLNKLSRILSVKYAAELLSPDMSGGEKDAVVRGNIAELYRKFMPEYSGVVSQIKEVYDLPYLEGIHTSFARLVGDLDSLNSVDLKKRCIEAVQKIQDARSKLADFVKLNKDDPAFTAWHARKKLASTVDKILTELASALIKQMSKIELTPNTPVMETTPTAAQMLKSRKRMEQTPEQTKMLVFKFGDLYGVEDMLDYGKIKNKDAELAFELMTAFLGLNRASRSFTKQEYYDPKDPKHRKKELEFLKSKVKLDLKERILKLLGRKG